MLAVFYQLNKRQNSLKTPTNADITISGEVSLKQDTSVHEPSFIMACSTTDMPTAMISNYCAWNNTYYWVNDVIVVSKNHIMFTCKEDVLATYKNEILLSSAYVMYSTSHGLMTIPDARLQMTTTNRYGEVSANCNDIFTESLGTILCVVNTQTSSLVSPYFLESNMVIALKEALYSPDFLQYMANYFSNPLECVINGQLTALRLSNTIARNIYVGDNNLGVDGCPFDSSLVVESTYTLVIPWQYSDFRNRSPYTHVTMFLPFVGYFDLDTAMIHHSREITVQAFVEAITGKVIYKIYANRPSSTEALALIDVKQGNCNSNIPIARVENADVMQSAVSAVGALVSIGTENYIGAVFSAGQYFDSLRQTTQINGSISSASGAKMGLHIILEVWSTDINIGSRFTELKGHPLNSTVELGTLSGYCQTNGASINVAGSEEEIREVNTLLDRGVYIE